VLDDGSHFWERNSRDFFRKTAIGFPK